VSATNIIHQRFVDMGCHLFESPQEHLDPAMAVGTARLSYPKSCALWLLFELAYRLTCS
jgi:hypothetical protein